MKPKANPNTQNKVLKRTALSAGLASWPIWMSLAAFMAAAQFGR